MTGRHTRLIRGATLAAGAAGLSVAGPGPGVPSLGPGVASAHNVASDADRAVELYDAMQRHFYLGASQGYLYNETSPRGRSNPYAYLWPFYEAMAATIDLAGVSPQFAST